MSVNWLRRVGDALRTDDQLERRAWIGGDGADRAPTPRANGGTDMQPTTIFITRYVDDHAAGIDFYRTLFGREPDAAPVPDCREWELQPGVLFQVIRADHPRGVSFAFGVDDLGAERDRLTDAGVAVGEPWPVGGFDGLCYAEVMDPEGGATGLLGSAE